MKKAKIEQSNLETRNLKMQSSEMLKAKEYLTVREAAILINCSRQTVYALIQENKIRGINIKVKKTLIPQSEITNLFSKH
ncbi:helix-turn-helix domain-containing protein [Candidatus Nomurabacteria bacterium]|nr:helix-turn-helix domain-containing protein [Candidatus Nomurabacteria bacterium]